MLLRVAKLQLIVAVLIWFGVIAPAAAQWDTKTIEGRDYVAVDGMKSFYGFDTVARSGNDVILENKKVKMRLHVGAQECLMNGVKFVFSYKVEEIGGKAWVSRIDLSKLIDPVLRPSYIDNAGNFRTVILDAGHGGKDPGATNALSTEATYNLQVAERVQKLLESRGYKVVMTRDSNRYLTLQERVDVANNVKDNAIFISIHHNSGGSAARGIETFTLSPIGVAHYGRGLNQSDYQERAGNSHDSANVALATAVHGCMSRRLGTNTFDRGIKRARFSVLTGVQHPSILVECGFMTHPYEARLIHTEAYRTAVVSAIGEAVERYRKAVSMKPVTKE
ncbi:N-acetylmuramoyl-L-alanine amidase [Haloferula sp. BvORR071]|uniref:N-acetylmuramoyl-L-alanine amidase family protein n=1 Tax=Haloferula sp. BvORR071 TaxID=1396141 RepID=UPI0006965F28|nr:N-acetylmuramoyl-L-alanine amidase [Haloferula sp. BvORR071]